MGRPRKNIKGTVYLLHFSPPFKHAKHYLGWSARFTERLARHAAGHGSPLVRAAIRAGSRVELARVWHGVDRHFERSLHKRGGKRRFCPCCPKTRGSYEPRAPRS